MDPNERNKIEDLKQSLYERDAPKIKTNRKLRYSDEESDLPRDWGRAEEEKEEVVLNQEYEDNSKRGMSFFTKLLISSFVFCVLAVGVGAYMFFNGSNFISGDNIDIKITGPISISGGSPSKFEVTVINKNNVALKTVDLHIKFPAGSTDPVDTTTLLEDVRYVMGDIPAGGSASKSVESVIFGEQNSQKKILATVTYGIAGSSSVFTKENSHDVLISASPIVVSINSIKETISGQSFDVRLNIKSNSTNTIKNVLVKAVYPFGFSFKTSSLKPLTIDNTVWNIGDIPPGGERTVSVTGSLTGEDDELRVFNFSVGARNPTNPNIIGTAFMDVQQEINIRKPFISLDISIDGDTGLADKNAKFGKSTNVRIRWANNLPETVKNLVIVAHLDGSAYDKTYVTSWGGYYRSGTDDMIWDQRTNPELATVSAGASGNLTFNVTPSESGGALSNITNPEINIQVYATGDRVSNINVPMKTGETARRIKVSTETNLSGRILRNSGPFINTGPIPPVSDRTSTYTVVWSIDNTNNVVTNAVVTATLPPYVTWTGQVSPQSEDIKYDSNSGLVTWNVGRINTYTSSSGRKEVAFQVSVEPSVEHVGTSPIIVNQARLTGLDNWTKESIENAQIYLTTSFSTDTTFRPGDGVVVKAP